MTYVKIQDVTADRLLGRLTTVGVMEELTAAQVVALLEAISWAFSGTVGFHGVSATAQQADPGAPSLTTISGSGDDSNINTNFAELEASINGIRTALNNKGLTG